MNEIEAHYAQFEADQIAAGRVCGSCELFADEDLSGLGWCHFGDVQRDCGDTCRHWNKRVDDGK